jgi:hypothetical protein
MRGMSVTSITSSDNERLRNSRPLNSKCQYGIVSIFGSTLHKLIQCFRKLYITCICISNILFHVAHLVHDLERVLDDLRIGVRFKLGAKSIPFVTTCILALGFTQASRSPGGTKFFTVSPVIFNTSILKTVDLDSSVGIAARYGLDGPGIQSRRSQWTCGLRRGSLAARLLGSWVRILPIPVAVRSKAWVCGRSLTRIVGSNPTGGMDVCLL